MIFVVVYMKYCRVCMNFVRLVWFAMKMYAASVGWLPPASVSLDWCPCPRTDAAGILRVAVGDALMVRFTTHFLGNSTVLQTGVLLFEKYPQIGICDILINIAMRILRKKAENLLTVAMLIEEPWKFTFVLMSNEIPFKNVQTRMHIITNL